MKSTKQEKQTYLFKQIIEANYDPEEFQEYMFNFKQNADDLDQWSMQELSDVVTSFKTTLKENHAQNLRGSILLEQTHHEDIVPKKQKTQSTFEHSQPGEKERKQYRSSTIVMKEEGKYLEYDYKSKHQIFSQTIQCTVIPPNNLLTKDVQIKVQKFTKKEGGLFEQSYICYHVFTPVLGVRVERRYSDFEWLRKHLAILHPGLPIPPIAKKGQFRRYDDKHLWKRMLILEMFLNKLMEIPELKAELIVEEFLKIPQKAAFEKFKASYKGNTTPDSLKKLKNMKGKINLTIQPRINSFLARSQKNLNQTQPQIKRLYKEFKAAATQLEGCSSSLQNIAKLCEDLNRKDQSFRNKVQLKYNPNNVFTCLGEATLRLSQKLEQEAQTYRKLFYAMLKYESLHMLHTLDAFDNLAETQKLYNQSKFGLLKKKVKLYEQGNSSKWGLGEGVSAQMDKNKAIQIMLPKQTKQLEKIREKYAQQNFQMYEQMNRFYSSKNYHLGRFLQEYCRLQTKINSERMMIWVDMETNVMSMRENKYLQKC